MRRFIPILSCLLFVFSPAGGEDHLAVYLPDYRASVAVDAEFYGTTNLILFSAEPEEDGTVNFSRITPELLSVGKVAKEEKEIEVTVCVGGWGRGKTFASAVSKEEHRVRFVKDLVTFCREHQLDGVDIDWEFPKGDQEHADFALFLSRLAKELRAEGRIVTIALGYTRPLPKECWPHIDRVHLMSYQPWNDQPYEPWLRESIELFLDSGLPPEKLLAGLGFFAKEKAGERRAVPWKKMAEPSNALLSFASGYWPVGKETCDLRVKLAEEYSLGGVMVWEFGHDTAQPESSLLNYLSTALK